MYIWEASEPRLRTFGNIPISHASVLGFREVNHPLEPSAKGLIHVP